MTANLSQVADMADELVIDTATLTGGYDLIGTLDFNPVQIIFDNQSDAAVGISKNGTSTWHTFPAGEAIVLDMRGNKGMASNYTFPLHTNFYAIGTAGTGNFSITYTYAVT
jgi:hypothetical protein